MKKTIPEMEYVSTNLAKIADSTKVNFCVSVSTSKEKKPKFIK